MGACVVVWTTLLCIAAIVLWSVGLALYVPQSKVHNGWKETTCTISGITMYSDDCCHGSDCDSCQPCNNRLSTDCECSNSDEYTCYVCEVELTANDGLIRASDLPGIIRYPNNDGLGGDDYVEIYNDCGSLRDIYDQPGGNRTVACWFDPDYDHGDTVEFKLTNIITAAALGTFIAGNILCGTMFICMPIGCCCKSRGCGCCEGAHYNSERARNVADNHIVENAASPDVSNDARSPATSHEGSGSHSDGDHPTNNTTTTATTTLPQRRDEPLPSYSDVIAGGSTVTSPGRISVVLNDAPKPQNENNDAPPSYDAVRQKESAAAPPAPGTPRTPTGGASARLSTVRPAAGAAGGGATSSDEESESSTDDAKARRKGSRGAKETVEGTRAARAKAGGKRRRHSLE